MRLRDLTAAEQPSEQFIKALDAYLEGYVWYMGNEEYAPIHAAFQAEMPVLEQSRKCWRGLNLEDWDGCDAIDFRRRPRIRFADYASATTSPQSGDYWMRRVYNDDQTVYILFEIDTKPGARGIVVNDYSRFLTPPDRQWTEIILNRGSEFNVVAKERRPCRWAANPAAEYWQVKLEQVK